MLTFFKRTTKAQHILLAAVLLIIAGWSLWLLANYVWDFLQPGAYVLDSTLYWAMGRAILNDLTLYTDIFDNKPPGVYFLSAISIWFFDDGRLGNLLGTASLICLPLLGLIFAWREKCRGNLPRNATCILATLSVALTVSWIAFQARFGRPWQTEQFAALFAACYAFLMVTMARPQAWRTILLGACLMASVGFKEPFLISCLAAAILYDSRLKTLKHTFLMPLIVAIILGVIILALTGVLLPYLLTDLPTVLGYRITGFTQPFLVRALSVHRPLAQLSHTSKLLPLVAIVLPVVHAVLNWKPKPKTTGYIRPALTAALIIILGTLSIGIGGDFQDHHYAVPAPLIATIIFLTISAISKQWHKPKVRLLTMGLLLLSGASIFLTHNYDVSEGSEDIFEREKALRIAAAGVDEVLNRCGIDRYLYIHPQQELRLDGFTQHSPMNHALFYPIDQAFQNGPGFLEVAINRISQSDVIVTHTDRGFITTNNIGKAIIPFIKATFSKEPPPCALPLPQTPGFSLIFRQNDAMLHYREE